LTIAAVIVAMLNVLLPFRIDRGASKRDAATGRQVLEKQQAAAGRSGHPKPVIPLPR
jgi:hypothetical protein